MARLWHIAALAACLTGLGWAQAVEEPPEEDAGRRDREYAFNPLQAAKELQVGDFYFKKESWKAAAGRYREATRWNPGYAEAYQKLGESLEKMDLRAEARVAYEKFLELAPKDKAAPEIRVRLKRLSEAGDAPSPAPAAP